MSSRLASASANDIKGVFKAAARAAVKQARATGIEPRGLEPLPAAKPATVTLPQPVPLSGRRLRTARA